VVGVEHLIADRGRVRIRGWCGLSRAPHRNDELSAAAPHCHPGSRGLWSRTCSAGSPRRRPRVRKAPHLRHGRTSRNNTTRVRHLSQKKVEVKVLLRAPGCTGRQDISRWERAGPTGVPPSTRPLAAGRFRLQSPRAVSWMGAAVGVRSSWRGGRQWGVICRVETQGLSRYPKTRRARWPVSTTMWHPQSQSRSL